MARNKSLTFSLQTSEDQSSEIIERNRRQVGPSSPSPLAEAEPTEELLVEEPKKGPRWRSHFIMDSPNMRMYRNLNHQATQPLHNKTLQNAQNEPNQQLTYNKLRLTTESTAIGTQTFTILIKHQLNIPIKNYFTKEYKQFWTWRTIHETWAWQRIPFL